MRLHTSILAAALLVIIVPCVVNAQWGQRAVYTNDLDVPTMSPTLEPDTDIGDSFRDIQPMAKIDKGKGDEMPCIIPFWYKGIEYNGCTLKDFDHLWCPTVWQCSDSKTRKCDWKDDQWGYCTPDVRVVPGVQKKNELHGHVEILHTNLWGYACAKDFNNSAADVVCRTIGYHGGYTESSIPHPGNMHAATQSTQPILLTGTGCLGHEARLQDCPGLKLNPERGCCDGEVARVYCYNCNKGSCLHGGVCHNHDRKGDGRCSCPSNTRGKRCEEINICGENLLEMRRHVCGTRDKFAYQKRSIDELTLSETEAKTMTLSRKRRLWDEDINAECCKNGERCTMHEVEEFCENKAEEN